jgi:hypothetical protein
VLVPLRSVAEKSNTPVSKSVVISIEPSANGEKQKIHESTRNVGK